MVEKWICQAVSVCSLITRLFPLHNFKFACKEGESLVYFDHVLDVVGRGYPLTADFAHVHRSITMPKVHLCGQKHYQSVCTLYMSIHVGVL